MMKSQGKVAIVTDGVGDMGKATSLRLAKKDATLVINYSIAIHRLRKHLKQFKQKVRKQF